VQLFYSVHKLRTLHMRSLPQSIHWHTLQIVEGGRLLGRRRRRRASEFGYQRKPAISHLQVSIHLLAIVYLLFIHVCSYVVCRRTAYKWLPTPNTDWLMQFHAKFTLEFRSNYHLYFNFSQGALRYFPSRVTL
jgi:hypothetical protein